MKKSAVSRSIVGLSIWAGALRFMDQASAGTLISEDFEGGTNVFGTSTYNYSQLYTQRNWLTPGGGNTYGTGLSGFAVKTLWALTAAGSPFFNLVGGGITTAQIDAGVVGYDLSGQFSTYQAQNDHAELTLRYFDGSEAELSSVVIGGLAFVLDLSYGAGLPPDSLARAWGTDQERGAVPPGARTVTLEYRATRLAGEAADAYLDNILLTVNAVPEPSAALGAVLAGSILTLRRQRRTENRPMPKRSVNLPATDEQGMEPHALRR